MSLFEILRPRGAGATALANEEPIGMEKLFALRIVRNEYVASRVQTMRPGDVQIVGGITLRCVEE